ncbi:MAG: ArsR/SmtB family transcription factor [Paracoccaceae bacterium]
MEPKVDPNTALLDAAQAFAALGSEQRLCVIRTLVRAGPEGLSIGELADRTGINGANLTHHLRFLTHAGLVSRTRKGRSIICAAVAYERVQALADYLLSECCADTSSSIHEHGNPR